MLRRAPFKRVHRRREAAEWSMHKKAMSESFRVVRVWFDMEEMVIVPRLGITAESRCFFGSEKKRASRLKKNTPC